MQFFVLRRKGEFKSEAPKGTIDWCRNKYQTDFQYEIRMVVEDKGQKIIMYHEKIDDRILINPPIGTCEQMCHQLCDTIKNLCRENNVKQRLIHLTIKPKMDTEPLANLDYLSYDNEDDLKLLPLI